MLLSRKFVSDYSDLPNDLTREQIANVISLENLLTVQT